MTVNVAAVACIGVFGGLFLLTCIISAVKACRDRRAIKKRIAAKRCVSAAITVTTSTSADSVDRPRSASQYGDLGAPELFNYRRSSYGSNVIVRTIDGDAYDYFSVSSKHNYLAHPDQEEPRTNNGRVYGRLYPADPINDGINQQRRRSYAEAMANPSLLYFPPKTERRSTDPIPTTRIGRDFYKVRNGTAKTKCAEIGRNCYEMNGLGGTENRGFDSLEESHRF